MTKEQLILARVRTENGAVSICADERLSIQIRERMLACLWDFAETQEPGMKLSQAAQPAAVPVSNSVCQDDVLADCRYELGTIAENKDIMYKIPEKTKLRLIKRVLNRLMRLTNRYQQIVNNSVWNILGILTGTLEWVKNGLHMTDDKANRALTHAEQNEQRICKEEDEQNRLRAQLKECIKFNDRQTRTIQILQDQMEELESECEERIAQIRMDYASRCEEDASRMQQMQTRLDQLQEKIELILKRIEEQQSRSGEQQEKIELMLKRIEEQKSQSEEQMVREEKSQRDKEHVRKAMGAMARDLIRTKWQLRDTIEARKDERDLELHCGICGYRAPMQTFETRETDCIFAGGHLKRFVCPQCGCVFGPTKFSGQTKEEFDDDYVVHYTGFHEGDSTHKEIFAFQKLQPNKTGVYLDYGCGSWSHTIAELRAQGYQIYGYEPYAADSDNPYVITDKKVLAQMRFDGIFSNDLLEHLADPIEELQFMKLLLRTPESKMSHCTGCFQYKYEYTRFHMFFFTGDSVSIMAEKAGLSILSHDDEPKTGDPCYVFGVKESKIDLMSRMLSTDKMRTEDGIVASEGSTIYGPYLTLPAGRYLLTMKIKLAHTQESVRCRMTCRLGEKTLQEITIYDGSNHIWIDFDEVQTDLEFVIENRAEQGSIVLEDLTLAPGLLIRNQ